MAASSSPPRQRRHREERGLCVSVVSHGQGELIDRLLCDLLALPAGTVARLVVTVNLASDAWEPLPAASALAVTVLRNQAPQGFAANHNQAFAHCDTPYFAVLNPDIRLDADPFPALVRQLQEQPDFAFVAPVQTDSVGQRQAFARRLPTPWSVVLRRLLPTHWQRGLGDQPPQWVSGAFMLWRADTFGALGGFDERYRLYCEDVDICLRLQLRGKRFAVVGTARVVHDARRSSAASAGYLWLHVQSLCRLWLSPVFWRYLFMRPGRPLVPA